MCDRVFLSHKTSIKSLTWNVYSRCAAPLRLPKSDEREKKSFSFYRVLSPSEKKTEKLYEERDRLKSVAHMSLWNGSVFFSSRRELWKTSEWDEPRNGICYSTIKTRCNQIQSEWKSEQWKETRERNRDKQKEIVTERKKSRGRSQLKSAKFNSFDSSMLKVLLNWRQDNITTFVRLLYEQRLKWCVCQSQHVCI